MDIAIRLRGFQLLISFLGRIGSVLKDLGLKDGIESICIQVTFFTRVNNLCINFIKCCAGRFYHCMLSNLGSKQNE